MSQKHPTFGLSYLSPSSLATATIDVQNIDTSTPINIRNDNADQPSLDSIEIGDEFTPTNMRRRNKNTPLPSILKNSSSNRSLAQPANSSYYSTLSDTKQDPGLDLPARQRVLFSPTKEVVSYFAESRKEFRVDLTNLDEDVDGAICSNDRQPKTWLWTDPSVPYVLLLYLQLLCNVLLVLLVVYVLYVMVVNIRADVRHKIEIYTSDAIQEISKCSRNYYRNKCSTDGNKRAPALEEVCTTWEKCMNRDPQQIGRSKITAETFADIVNGFFRPISWKSLFMSSLLLVASFVVTNFAFGSYRKVPAHRNEAARIEELEKKLIHQEKLLMARNQVLPATPPSQFISNYDDGMYSPLKDK